MKHFSFWRSVILFLLLSVKVASAQQNLIDVPSSEIVEEQKVFVQQQFSASTDDINASTIITYGLGNGFEAGLALHQMVFQRSRGVEIDQSQPEDNPDFLFNAQKVLELTDRYNLSIGTRTGVAASHGKERMKLATFNYVGNAFSFGNDHRFVIGGYYANKQYAGAGNEAGIMVGADIKLKKDKLDLLVDATSGSNALSVINVGIEFFLSERWSITAGGQLPVPGSDNDEAAVIQITRK